MSKMLRIDACHDCKHIRQNHGEAVCAYRETPRVLPYISVMGPHIPYWCELDDAPAWHTVRECDEERDEGDALIGAEYLKQCKE